MSDKMREEFEVWVILNAGNHEYPYMDRVTAKFPDGSYLTTWVDSAWIGWQASRAALCVNACAGMTDPAAEIAELKRQRDELLDVLGAAIPLIKQARLDWCDQNSESYDEDVVTPYDAILYRPILSLLETKGSSS